MRALTLLRLRLGWLQPRPPTLQSWFQQRDCALLLAALRGANSYKTRLFIIEGLDRHGLYDHRLYRHLIRLMAIDLPPVAAAAAQLIERRTFAAELQPVIDQALAVYHKRLEGEANRHAALQDYHYRRDYRKLIDKSQMERLAIVREQLKKPIR